MKTSRPTGLPMVAVVNPMAKISILFSVLFLAFCLTAVNAGSHHSKGVQVTVKAKWSGTSLLLEAGEFLAKENKDFFWQFLYAWMDLLGGGQKIPSDQECLDVMLATAKVTLGEELLPLLHLSLALRRSSPKMILYKQLAEEALSRHQEEKLTACCWIDVGLQLLTGPEGLAKWLSQLEERSSESARGVDIHSFDHVHPASVEGKPVAVLYGALGTVCFGQLHTALAEAAEQGFVKYVFRPVLLQRCESDADRCTQLGTGGPINLGGYGVELALKNMEYKAIDDSKVQSSKKGNDDEAAGLEAEDLSQDVKGFIFSKLLERKPELTAELLTFRDNLLSTTHAMDKVAVWELKDLGFQAAQRIALASEPLRLMQEMSQNFPNLVSSLSRMKLNKTIKEEISRNQRMLMAGKSLIAINGALLNAESLELFSLLDTIQGELSLARMLSSLRLPKPSVRELLRVMPAEAKGEVRVDMRSDEYLHHLNNIEQDAQYKSWRTNLQELLMPVFPGQMRYVRKNLFNAHYALDPGSIAGMKEIETLMYYYTNGVPIRFAVVFVSSYVMAVLDHYGGDLPDDAFSDTSVNAEDMSSLVIQVFLWAKENAGSKAAFDFLSHLSASEVEASRTEIVKVEEIVEALTKALKGQAKKTKSAAEIVEEVHSSGQYFEQVVASTSFVYSRGLAHLVPCLLMNGDVHPLADEASKKLMDVFHEEMGRVQEAIYYQSIRQKTDVLAFFLKESGVTRYNPQVLESSELHVYVPLSDATAAAQTGDTSPLASLQYLHHQGTEDNTKPITHWLVLDLTTTAGVSLLRQALRYLSDPERTMSRLAIFHNPVGPAPGSDAGQLQLLLPRIVLAATSLRTRRSKLVPFLQQLLASTIAEAGTSSELMSDQAAALVVAAIEEARKAGVNGLEFEVALQSKAAIEKALTRIQEERNFVKKTFGIPPGVQAIVTNGRVLYPKTTSSFMAEDFALLERVQYERQVERIESIVNQIDWVDIDPDDLNSDFLSTVIMAVSSCVSARTRSGDSARFDMLQAQHGAIVHENNDAAVHIDAVIDPLSGVGQRLTPLLVLIQEWMQPSLRILLNPQTSLSDVPLKNFYRFAAPLTRDPSVDVLEEGSSAVFSNMPASRTLTINLFVPEAWLVEQVVAPMDLDNLILSKMEDTNVLNAVYELEAIVITGHCMEANREPPRGLQLLLGTEQEPHVVDTIVMANLGYFQLKAAPGLWTLSLAPGRSSQLFTMPGPGEGTEEGPLSMPVVLADLTGSVVRLEVKRRRGKEGYKILDTGDGEDMDSASEEESQAFDDLEELSDEEEVDEDAEEALPPQGLWEQLREKVLAGVRNLMGIHEQSSNDIPEPKQPPRKAPPSHTKVTEAGVEVKKEAQEKGGGEEEDKTINIFSIASGLLYERFTRIMILSVLKNTQRPVKFWFIKNYLSPSFKDTIREMAQEYGFGVELVTYKWPAWLHKQTDKQRLIWAYKILFLDVLFPLSLKKVIFVDADQIVRADMAELYDMDLHGRPLAYTPFCDNNKDMDGFRFWKQGFWRDHLRGRPYHISALYVVDLVKFRQEAAGDHLRVFYESLSKDPNSLANLDQDLPNYAQHSVQIFSLPQEWLWCESWCGNATKARAKTIDLCNNPLTKEPKLDGARRIVKEWPALDDEQRQFMERLQGQGQGEAAVIDAAPVVASVPDDTPAEAESDIAQGQDSYSQEEDAQEQELEQDEVDEVESVDESGRDPETAGEL